MAGLSEPPRPDDLPDLVAGDVRALPAGSLLLRIHKTMGPQPSSWNQFRAYGPLDGARFDHHGPSRSKEANLVAGDRSVWYGAVRAAPRRPDQPDGHGAADLTAIAEAFADTRVIDRLAHQPWMTLAESARALTLLDAESQWWRRAGCGGPLGRGSGRRARAWSRAVHARYPEVDGIVWSPSVWPPGEAVVLYERAADALPAHPSLIRPLADPALRPRLLHVAEQLGGWLVR